MDETDRSGELRDITASAFTPILRRLWMASRSVLAVCFVDHDGECVDYCSSIDPFDAKVAGAHMRIVMVEAATAMARTPHGKLLVLHVVGDSRELIAARVGPEYTLVVVLSEGGAVRAVSEMLERTVAELRVEAGIDQSMLVPIPGDLIAIETRAARGWPYAPAAIVEAGKRTIISAVLGRWTEGGAVTGGDLVCFRVTTSEGEELTLAHEPKTGRWMKR